MKYTSQKVKTGPLIMDTKKKAKRCLDLKVSLRFGNVRLTACVSGAATYAGL